MIVYPAADARHAHWFLALQAAGIPLEASWLTWSHTAEPTTDAWNKRSETSLREAAEADIVLLYAQEDDAAHVQTIMEAAAALSHGQTVFLVSPHAWPMMRNHPKCRSFATLANAVTAICAWDAGAKAREEALRELQSRSEALWQ